MDGHDSLPPRVRRRLVASPFNLCPLCIWDFMPDGALIEPGLMAAIPRMEEQIRERNDLEDHDAGLTTT